jgi:hypothetical protein
MFDFEETDEPSRPTWKVGNNAGGAITKNGDLWVANHVTTPKGEPKILVTYYGFRDTPEGRIQVVLDRRIVDPPKRPDVLPERRE